MKLTIGMASYNNHSEVWFTVQALRMYQDLTDTELLIIDNFGDQNLDNWVNSWCGGLVRYIRHNGPPCPSNAKNRIFAEAKGDWVISIDSHVLLAPGVVARFKEWTDNNPDCMDLLHGPLLYDDIRTTADAMNDQWGSDGLWGTWRTKTVDKDAEPYEIPMHGMGLFACRKDAWLNFNPSFRGFGGEEGYIHTKYRQAGRKILLLPFMQWNHYFRPQGKGAPYAVNREDRIRNYQIGFDELGIDKTEILKHFNLQK